MKMREIGNPTALVLTAMTLGDIAEGEWFVDNDNEPCVRALRGDHPIAASDLQNGDLWRADEIRQESLCRIRPVSVDEDGTLVWERITE